MKTHFEFKKLLAIPVLLGLALYFNACKKDNPVPAPVITAFSPVSGLEGATVTITGKNFSATASSNTVMFNNVAATVSAATATDLTVTVPVGATTGPISVGTNGSTATSSTDFTVLFPPTASAFSPTSGAPGATFIITGTNFSTTPGDNNVKINNVVATVTAATATQLTVTVPTGATTGKVSVTTNGVTVTSPNDFTVLPAPTIVSFSPATLAIGGTLTITGTDFSTNLADNFVMINNVPVTVASATATQLTVVIPAGVTSGAISVTTNGAKVTSATNIAIVPPPTITSFSPTSGLVGSTVIITGTNFSTNPAENEVWLSDALMPVTAATSTQLTVTVPVGISNGLIFVVTHGITVTSTASFTVPPPTITSFTPAYGLPGTTVTITGTNFSPNLADNIVSFSSTPLPTIAATVTAATATQLTVTVPAGAITGVLYVKVTNTESSVNQFDVLKDVPRTGLIALYPFSNHGKETITVSTARDFDMAATRSPSYTADRHGTNAYALSFNGTTQYGFVNTQIITAQPWTISFWMKAALGSKQILSTMSANLGLTISEYATTSADALATSGDDGPAAGGTYVLHNPTKTTVGYLTSALANTWVHIAVTFDALNYNVYLNGKLVQSNTMAAKTATPPGTMLFFGGDGTLFYTGSLDDLIIYNRAVTATEAADLYNQTITKY